MSKLDIKAIMDSQRQIEEDRKNGREIKVEPYENKSPEYKKLLEEHKKRIRNADRWTPSEIEKCYNYIAKSKEVVTKEFTTGDVRLGMGLVRDSEEQEEYIQKSLRKRLP